MAGPRTIVVIGGGIAGLAAAFELTGGASGPMPGGPKVIVLEAQRCLGGKLRTEWHGERMVEAGPDGFLGRRPEAVELCRELGLEEDLVPINANGAGVWARGRLRHLPDGLVLGVPTRFWPVVRSRVLGLGSVLRLSIDQVLPRRDMRGPLGDRAIGPLVARKLGRGVVSTLVDPLVGGIHAGSVADMSTAAVFPLLLAAAQRRGGLMRSLRRASLNPPPGDDPTAAPDGPAFWGLARGLGSLVDRLEAVLFERGALVRMGVTVDRLERSETGPAWSVQTAEGLLGADGIVLAVPAQPAAALLESLDSDAAALLRAIDHASVALITLSYPESAFELPLYGTGFLVPPGTATHSGEPMMVTAATNLSAKWPHLARPGEVLLRASVGRFGDERFASHDDGALVDRVVDELRQLTGASVEPTPVAITRWPDSFPQYRVHHLLRVTGIESGMRRLPAAAVAGSAYRGVGIPACVGSGRAAARAVLEALEAPGDPQP